MENEEFLAPEMASTRLPKRTILCLMSLGLKLVNANSKIVVVCMSMLKLECVVDQVAAKQYHELRFVYILQLRWTKLMASLWYGEETQQKRGLFKGLSALDCV